MTNIVFIYSINNSPIEYGKILLKKFFDSKYIDKSVRKFVLEVLTDFRSQKSLPNIETFKLSIISVDNEYYSKQDKDLFNLYIDQKSKTPNYYYNNELVPFIIFTNSDDNIISTDSPNSDNSNDDSDVDSDDTSDADSDDTSDADSDDDSDETTENESESESCKLKDLMIDDVD